MVCDFIGNYQYKCRQCGQHFKLSENYAGIVQGEMTIQHWCGYQYNQTFNYTDNNTDNNLTSNKMNIKEKFLTSLKKEPEKSFRKAGITDGDDFLTSDGTQVFLCWLLQKYGKEFNEDVVKDILKEEKDEKECC